MRDINSYNNKKIEIKNKEEAQKYLDNLNILFWFVFIGGIIVLSIYRNDSIVVLMITILYLILYLYFVYFCNKVLKKENISRINLIWTFLFAPLVWIYFYPLITEPLKKIVNDESFPSKLNKNEAKNKQKKDKKYWRDFWVAMLFMLVMIASMIVISFLL